MAVESRQKVEAYCVEVDLPVNEVLYHPETTPKYAYILTSGVASVVTSTEEGGTAEVGLLGNEAVAGALHLLGPAKISTNCYMQLGGAGLRLPLSDLKKLFLSNEDVNQRLLEFAQVQMVSLSQLAGCNRLHDGEERLARWLLMAQDRVHSDVLDLTQEFLAAMLGSRRTTVTIVAGMLQRSGLIEYSRGRVRILDREGLRSASCDCYQVIHDLYVDLYRQPLPGIQDHAGIQDYAQSVRGAGRTNGTAGPGLGITSP